MTIYEIKTCPFCGKDSAVEVDADGYFAWMYEGKLIQDAMPNIDASTREILISGICEECQKKIFGE